MGPYERRELKKERDALKDRMDSGMGNYIVGRRLDKLNELLGEDDPVEAATAFKRALMGH